MRLDPTSIMFGQMRLEGIREARFDSRFKNEPAMPPLSKFRRFDVRPLLKRGGEPLPEILRRVRALEAGEGLIVVAPFLPSPLIELLGSQGFTSKIQPGGKGRWMVFFWREQD